LFLKGGIESKISEANSHDNVFISECDFSIMAISYVLLKSSRLLQIKGNYFKLF